MPATVELTATKAVYSTTETLERLKAVPATGWHCHDAMPVPRDLGLTSHGTTAPPLSEMSDTCTLLAPDPKLRPCKKR